MKYGLDFLDVPMRPGKPRTPGLTIVRDRIRGLGEQREFLETYGRFVNYAKFSNISARFYPESLLLEKLRLYEVYDVKPFLGGLCYENSVAQGKLDRFFDYIREIRVPAIEISENIVDLPQEEKIAAVVPGATPVPTGKVP